MERERKVKVLSVLALIVAVLGLTVAFAALSTTLTINGQAKVTAGTWDVRFTDESGTNSSISPENTATGSGTNATIESTKISGIDVTLKKPGDAVTYTFYVENKGDIDAKISTLSMDKPTCAPDDLPEGEPQNETKVCDNLVYTLTYDGEAQKTDDSANAEGATGDSNSSLAVENVLPSKTKRKVKLTIGYKTEATKIPTSQVTVTIPDITITYGQK